MILKTMETIVSNCGWKPFQRRASSAETMGALSLKNDVESSHRNQFNLQYDRKAAV